MSSCSCAMHTPVSNGKALTAQHSPHLLTFPAPNLSSEIPCSPPTCLSPSNFFLSPSPPKARPQRQRQMDSNQPQIAQACLNTALRLASFFGVTDPHPINTTPEVPFPQL